MNSEQTQFDEMFHSFGPNYKASVFSEESKFFKKSTKLIKPDPN
jgi:hypothetical protein